MQVNAAATAQAMERMGNGNVNGNGSGNGNGNREGAGRGLGSSVPIKLATFLKVNPPSSRGLIDPTKADDWFQTMEPALQAQHVLENQFIEFAAYQLLGEA
ncbi:hypothetical protein AHAS_Ahas11G0189600 [Arachis hypogaea]